MTIDSFFILGSFERLANLHNTSDICSALKRDIAKLVRQWMLPGAIVLGIGLYLIYLNTPALKPYGPALHAFASSGQRWVVALLLFFQFTKVPPSALHFEKWYLGAALIQLSGFLASAAGIMFSHSIAMRVPFECAMLCLVCPTAAAAGVITDRLGGKLSANVSYLMLINIAATFLIPLVIPLVSPSAELGFWAYVGRIALKIFPLLILPCLVAWLVRWLLPSVNKVLADWSPNSFYIWGVGLTLAMVLSARALVTSHMGGWIIASIVAVSMACCFLQFLAGRHLTPGSEEGRITAGQALGQKNTGFLIWLGYTYFTPVTSVAGGLYAIWQNLFNSWELWRKEHPVQGKS